MSIKRLTQCDETICREVNEVNECLGNMMDTIEQVADEDVKLQLMEDWNEEFKRLYDLMAKKLNDSEIQRMNNEFLKYFGEEKFGTKDYVKFTRKWFQKVADEINESNMDSTVKLIIQNGTDIVGKVKGSKVFIKYFVRELK